MRRQRVSSLFSRRLKRYGRDAPARLHISAQVRGQAGTQEKQLSGLLGSLEAYS